MKYLITILASIVCITLIACDDTVSESGEHSREKEIQSFIEHAEEDHFNNSEAQDTVVIENTPQIHSDGDVYTIVFDGATSGSATLHFEAGSHERTFMSDEVFSLTVSHEGSAVLEREEVDLSEDHFSPVVIAQMIEYHLEPETTYTIDFADVSVDTLRLFVAPRGLEGSDGDHDDDH
jgi:hypothetical protein